MLESNAKAKNNKKREINNSKLLFALLATKSKITKQKKAAKK